MWSTRILTTPAARADNVTAVQRNEMVRIGSPLLVAALALTGCGGHDAGEPPSTDAAPVGVEMRTAAPSYSVTGSAPQIEMVLRNNGSQDCSLPSTPDGSVEILSVNRDGTAVVGVPARLDLYSGMAAVVSDSLRSVSPGASITIPIGIESDDNGSAVLVSTQQTDGDSGRTTSWPLATPGKYRLIAGLSRVDGIDRPDLPAMCPPQKSPATLEFEMAP